MQWTFIVPFVVALAGCAAPADRDDVAAAEAKSAVTGTYDAYLGLAARHGVRPRSGRPLVIGIRGRDVTGAMHPTRVTEAYDDTLVVLTADGRALVLPVSTHPWEIGPAPGAPDVDGDGRGDVGMIRPGLYLATRRAASRNIAGAPTYQVTTANGDDHLPGDRNTDHDDVYSEAERAASTARGDTLTAVLFHQAGAGAPPLIGCQGLAADDMRVLAREGGDRFDYLLVDAGEEEIPKS